MLQGEEMGMLKIKGKNRAGLAQEIAVSKLLILL